MVLYVMRTANYFTISEKLSLSTAFVRRFQSFMKSAIFACNWYARIVSLRRVVLLPPHSRIFSDIRDYHDVLCNVGSSGDML